MTEDMEDLIVVGEDSPSVVTSFADSQWRRLSSSNNSLDVENGNFPSQYEEEEDMETERVKKDYMEEGVRDSYSEEIDTNSRQEVEEPSIQEEIIPVQRKRSKNRIKPIRIGSDPTSEVCMGEGGK